MHVLAVATMEIGGAAIGAPTLIGLVVVVVTLARDAEPPLPPEWLQPRALITPRSSGRESA
jgi:hypothetical protein